MLAARNIHYELDGKNRSLGEGGMPNPSDPWHQLLFRIWAGSTIGMSALREAARHSPQAMKAYWNMFTQWYIGGGF